LDLLVRAKGNASGITKLLAVFPTVLQLKEEVKVVLLLKRDGWDFFGDYVTNVVAVCFELQQQEAAFLYSL
jgi:hypothetical protein